MSISRRTGFAHDCVENFHTDSVENQKMFSTVFCPVFNMLRQNNAIKINLDNVGELKNVFFENRVKRGNFRFSEQFLTDKKQNITYLCFNLVYNRCYLVLETGIILDLTLHAVDGKQNGRMILRENAGNIVEREIGQLAKNVCSAMTCR